MGNQARANSQTGFEREAFTANPFIFPISGNSNNEKHKKKNLYDSLRN